MSRESVYLLIDTERRKQDHSFGVAVDRGYPHPTWLAVLMEEVGEVAKEVLGVQEVEDVNPTTYEAGDKRYARDMLRDELVQVAAVAVAWLEVLQDQPKETAA